MDEAARLEGAEQTVDEESPTVQKFVKMLEHRILEGHSEASNRSWALTELGVPREKYEQIHAALMKAWSLAGTPAEVTKQLRDVARKRYEYLYQMAVKKEKIKEALHALDAQVKLDGLDQPPEGSLEDKIIGGVITNAARAQLAGLMEKAKLLAGKGVPKPIPLGEGDVQDTNPPGEGANGANGHTTKNGKPLVIDLRETKK